MILAGYENTVVMQRHSRTGCVPSAIEWMARYKGALDLAAYVGFQERFDLTRQGGTNDFESVAAAVRRVFPQVRVRRVPDFHSADDKLNAIRETLERQQPVLLSLAQARASGGCDYHVVPVVEVDSESVTVLWMNSDTIEGQRKPFPADEIRRLHATYPGGKDLLVWDPQAAQ